MTQLIRTILAELERADDQGRDWYGWATNQLGHAFGYMAIAMVLTSIWSPIVGYLAAIGLAIIKEATDGLRIDNRQGWRDCLTDLFFSAAGASLVIFSDAWDLLTLIGLATILLVGIAQRIKKTLS